MDSNIASYMVRQVVNEQFYQITYWEVKIHVNGKIITQHAGSKWLLDFLLQL